MLLSVLNCVVGQGETFAEEFPDSFAVKGLGDALRCPQRFNIRTSNITTTRGLTAPAVTQQFRVKVSNLYKLSEIASSNSVVLAKVLRLDYWRSFLKFNVVGLSGVAVNEGIFILLRSQGIYYLYASAIAIEVSIISNFIFNDLWTFRDRRSGSVIVRMVKFNVLMIVGLAAQLAIVYGATEYLKIDPILSNLIGIGGAFILRYLLSIRYAWMYKKHPAPKPVAPSAAVVWYPKPDIRNAAHLSVCQLAAYAFLYKSLRTSGNLSWRSGRSSIL